MYKGIFWFSDLTFPPKPDLPLVPGINHGMKRSVSGGSRVLWEQCWKGLIGARAHGAFTSRAPKGILNQLGTPRLRGTFTPRELRKGIVSSPCWGTPRHRTGRNDWNHLLLSDLTQGPALGSDPGAHLEGGWLGAVQGHCCKIQPVPVLLGLGFR